jgi:GTP:adenosylcobinamide-phosphate guanylyltransferase
MGAEFTTLVMGASRSGAEDRVARAKGMAHKSLVPIAGKEMLARVIDALKASENVGRIYVSIENDEVLRQSGLLTEMQKRGDFETVASGPNLAESVNIALQRIGDPYPFLITTGDNALHTPEIIDAFCSEAVGRDCDAVVAITPAEVVLAKYPEGQRAFHRFRDGQYSSCNMYALLNSKAAQGVRAFASGGQFAKNPRRMIGAFGILSFIFYKLHLLTLHRIMQRLSRVLGIRVEAAVVRFAEGPIDVDNERDLALVERILTEREAG